MSITTKEVTKASRTWTCQRWLNINTNTIKPRRSRRSSYWKSMFRLWHRGPSQPTLIFIIWMFLRASTPKEVEHLSATSYGIFLRNQRTLSRRVRLYTIKTLKSTKLNSDQDPQLNWTGILSQSKVSWTSDYQGFHKTCPLCSCCNFNNPLLQIRLVNWISNLSKESSVMPIISKSISKTLSIGKTIWMNADNRSEKTSRNPYAMLKSKMREKKRKLKRWNMTWRSNKNLMYKSRSKNKIPLFRRRLKLKTSKKK